MNKLIAIVWLTLLCALAGGECPTEMDMMGDGMMDMTDMMPDMSNDNDSPAPLPPPPPPSGACCFIDTSCFDGTEDDCVAAGGSFNQGEACDTFGCPAPSMEDVRALAHGLEGIFREDAYFYLRVISIVGREYWNMNGDDPIWTNELLGRNGQTLDPDGEITTRTFFERYKVIRAAQTLIRAAENTEPPLTMEQLNSTVGFAKTIQAYSLLLVANLQFSNGIIPETALDDDDPAASALSYADSLQHIADLLDTAAVNLTNGGATFIFDLSHGFAGFDRPATLRQVNRALSARVRLYQGDKAGSISGIAGSFFNINGSLSTGPGHSYSIETRNPLYNRPDVDLYTAHADFIGDAVGGDIRVANKTRMYVATPTFFVPVSFEGLVGSFQVEMPSSSTASIPIIRNEELILIYAEAQIGSDVNEVLAAVNRVRNAAGLGNYLGATNDASLLNEVLRQRRYSLFGEGHRWIDLRRTGKFGEINVDRVGDVVHMEFPRPPPDVLSDL